MPMLDVSFVTMDPMLADTFSVKRQEQAISDKGRVETTETLFENLTGVVTQQDPSDLMKRDDGQFVPRSIFVASKFAFRNAVEGFQPDVIIWHGTEYWVKQVYAYSRFGLGFYEVVASSQTAMDQPQ